MRTVITYLSVIAIWGTTPLAIKWSGAGPGFLFGVAARMSIGLAVILLVTSLLRTPVPWGREARRVYTAVGVSIFGAMTLVYWGTQQIPSGWVAVIFGLTPLLTSLIAALWLGERVTFTALAASLLGVVGLGVIFLQGMHVGGMTAWGITAVLVAVCIHALSAIVVKRLGASVPALAQTTGGLLVAAPLFVLAWLAGDGVWPQAVEARAWWAILYLAVMGSVVGFIAYYDLLRRISALKVSLITLVTPLIALLLGAWLNGEAVSSRVALGSGLILAALALHQWEGYRRSRS